MSSGSNTVTEVVSDSARPVETLVIHEKTGGQGQDIGEKGTENSTVERIPKVQVVGVTAGGQKVKVVGKLADYGRDAVLGKGSQGRTQPKLVSLFLTRF